MSRFVKYLRYKLTLDAPAIVTTLSGDPNSSTTQPFVPGGALRGVLASELLNRDVSADSNDFRRLILEGDVRFLHAYPADGSVRSLPTPIPWKKVKGMAGTSAHDLTAYTGQVDPETEFDTSNDGELSVDPVETWPTASLMRVEFPFLEFSGSTTRGLTVRTDARSHQQRDRVKGRSWKTTHVDGSEKAHGVLFAYEYLEPGQSFHGLIQVIADSETEAEAIIATIREILNGRQIAVGRSRRAGYGGAATMSLIRPNHMKPFGEMFRTISQSIRCFELTFSLLVSSAIPSPDNLTPAHFPDSWCNVLAAKQWSASNGPCGTSRPLAASTASGNSKYRRHSLSRRDRFSSSRRSKRFRLPCSVRSSTTDSANGGSKGLDGWCS